MRSLLCSTLLLLLQASCKADCQSTCLSCTASSTCTACAENTYLSAAACKPCAQGCKTCSSDKLCLACAAGYYLPANSFVCKECPVKSCTSCVLGAVCEACASGYFLKDNACKECYAGCSSCTSATACTRCMTGYKANTANNTCDEIPGTPPHIPTNQMDGAAIAAIVLGAVLIIAGIGYAVFACKKKKDHMALAEEKTDKAGPVEDFAPADSEKLKGTAGENGTERRPSQANVPASPFTKDKEPEQGSVALPLHAKDNSPANAGNDFEADWGQEKVDAPMVKKAIKPKKLP